MITCRSDERRWVHLRSRRIIQTTNGVILTNVNGTISTAAGFELGWNAGRLAVPPTGSSSIRVLGFNTNHNNNLNNLFPNVSFRSARQVPIVFGMNFY
jgi:hypothetical protein